MITPREILDRLPADLRELVRPSVRLSTLTTLRVGGPAAVVCPMRNAEHARRFQAFCLESGIPSTILAGGSNILADDAGFPGVVLHPANEDFETSGEIVTVGAGLAFDELIRLSLEARLTGLEFASGIPGTVGGALVGNAGCYGRQIGDFLVQAEVLTASGEVARFGPDDFAFAYRRTRLQESGDLLLSARLRLERGDVEEAAASRAEKIADRRAKHPVEAPSAGSWFKNLDAPAPGERRIPAGRLLEQVGAKSMSVGGAAVFPRHANIIVNRGGASCSDVLELQRRMRDAVLERFSVSLEREVRYIGPRDEPGNG